MSKIKEWGNITWILMHSLAEKIDEKLFLDSKNIIIKIIFQICNNLPCPDCRSHAIKLLKKSYINNVKSKDDLKEFLFQLHNIVNKKLKKKEFQIENLDKVYKNANLKFITINFFNIYSNLPYNEKLMMDSFQRRIFLTNLKINLSELGKFLIID